MAEEQQNYKNHVRWNPLFHFVLGPLMLLNFLWACWSVYRWQNRVAVHSLLIAVILLLLGFLGRIAALKAQDRVIRLEERLRYARVLPPEQAARASSLPVNQIIALRFASDGELAGLVEKVLSGGLTSSKEIKMAIQDWQGDHHRV